MKNGCSLLVGCLLAGLGTAATAATAPSWLPVREVTVFKDGHALVLHQGVLPTDATGNVQMDYLPAPVVGTFWPYSADPGVKLSDAVASRQRVRVERTALTLRELLEANVGAQISFRESNDKVYEGTIAGFPTRTTEELTSTNPPNGDPLLPEKSNLVLIRSEAGLRALPVERLQDVTFKGNPKLTSTSDEFRNSLALKLDWGGRPAATTARVGMMYLQSGIRWVPNYKISIDGKGTADVRFQATLLNELADLDDVTANLVIGVPTFFFHDTIDPVSLQSAFLQLSPFFQPASSTGYALRTQQFSNAPFMSQYRAGERSQDNGEAGAAAANLPAVAGAGKQEDLFVFTLNHVSLKKKETMVLPVATHSLKYRDIFTLDLPMVPTREIAQYINNNNREAELAHLADAPQVMHKIRLANSSNQPFTTAPAMLMQGEQVLAQAMMTYTPVGASADVTITTAGDIAANRSDHETSRTPNSVTWQGNQYGRVDLEGDVSLKNYRTQAADIEVTRYVLGNVTGSDHGGTSEMVNVFDASLGAEASWLGGYGWPDWWQHFNGVGRITWKLHLDPGQSVDLKSHWHYFWR